MKFAQRSVIADASRRRTLFSLGALGAAATLPSLALAQTKQKAVLAYGGTGYTWSVPFVTEAAGAWAQQGVELETRDFPTGRDSMQALLAGSANFSTTTDTPLVLAVLQGLKPVVLANYSRYTRDMQIIARRDRGIDPQQPASLKGKKIGTPVGTSGQYALARYLAYAKLAYTDVTVVNLGPTDLINALVRGDIDAFSWTAQAGQAAARQSGDKVDVLTQEGFEKFFVSHQLLLTTQASLTQHPALADAALRALLAGEQRIKQNPDWAGLISQRIRIEPPQILTSTAVYEFRLGFDERFLDDLVVQAKWAIDNQLAPAPKGDLRQVFRAVIDDAPLKRIAPDRVTLA